ncbi:hydrogenase 4 subunit F [Telmatospirillum sp. J64-1]|uniref:hydrogenase 4 subunit F n=1 Tax=Telmatospirillum sp. J64-1 TaxID=2502183 RepID=UPI00115EF244|nr:hydrogenase 4 subunit F [Telmatospirillum sp. J64-1]
MTALQAANPLLWLLAAPLIGAGVLFLLPHWRLAALTNIAVSAVTFGLSLVLVGQRPEPTALLFIDDFNVFLVVLTAFVGLGSSIFSAAYISREGNAKRLAPPQMRLYHAMYQAFLFTMLLALTANNIGLLWVAIEAATLTTVMMVSLYRTRPAIEAAWKYFILCSVGIGLALFGTILVYMAAQPVLGAGSQAMAWTAMIGQAGDFQPALLSLAFVFILVGYGTKVGLAPLHNWLPDAHAEGPTPIAAVLSGLLLNVALYAILRMKMIVSANDGAMDPGPFMIAMGLSSLFVAALMLYRRRDIKRLFAYSSIEHMGIMTFAFGMGGALSNFAGLLHMTMHSLAKSAVFFAVGLAVQTVGSARLSDIRGLTVSRPVLGWGLVIGVVAIAGLPPMGIFMSEFLVVASAFAQQPLLAVPLILALLLTFGALVMRLQSLAFGEPSPLLGYPVPNPWVNGVAVAPMVLHLALVVIAGLWLPPALVAWFESVAAMLG